LPTWGVAQHAHCALGRWTPSGWVVNFGAGWAASWSDDPNDRGRRGLDFILEAQARKHPQAYPKVLRAQWVGDAMGEPKCDSTKEGSGGWWNVMALFEKKAIVAEAKPAELAALGTELGEANESAATKAMAVEKAVITEDDRKIVIDANGVITIPAAAASGAEPMKSFLGGQQLSTLFHKYTNVLLYCMKQDGRGILVAKEDSHNASIKSISDRTERGGEDGT